MSDNEVGDEGNLNAPLMSPEPASNTSSTYIKLLLVVLGLVVAGVGVFFIIKENKTDAPTMMPTLAPTAPTKAPTASPTKSPTSTACLCVFDIDRTLTGQQSLVAPTCPNNTVIPGVDDDAYDKGTLTLSQIALKMNETFCSTCYLGIISAGDASGAASGKSNEGDKLVEVLQKGGMLHPDATWSPISKADSPLITKWADGSKQNAIAPIIAWHLQRKIYIPDNKVWFFDDRAGNVQPFASTAWNARQVSCATRDLSHEKGIIGLCGSTLYEVNNGTGVVLC